MRWCCAPLAAASARSRMLLPSGGSPCELAALPRETTWSVCPPTCTVPVAAPAGVALQATTVGQMAQIQPIMGFSEAHSP
ncbi:hypothetical protein BHM03_00053357 [Ensete ventricosum]|nr:hypothetical protein BHM03_00053357 [Ensete ventricosum]